jgi:hypothetical protein
MKPDILTNYEQGLEATMTAPLPERGGRGKRLYEVTGLGKKAYEDWESRTRRVFEMREAWGRV